MKKVLLTSTMLVASAGMAAAEVTFDGFGRFGLFYSETDVAGLSDTRIEQRFRLNIVGSAETDGGVEFGARLRIQSDEDGTATAGSTTYGNGNGGVVSAPEFNVTAGGFRLDVGSTSDVIDSGDVVDYYGYGVGLTSFLEQSSDFGLPASGFGGGGSVAPTIKARYSAGDFTVAASYTDNAVDTNASEYQVGFGYNFGNYSAGIAFGSEETAGDDNDFWAASFGGTVGTIGFSLLIADEDIKDDTAFGASVLIPVGAATEARIVVADNGIDGDDTAYGVGFRHSLGGGVSLRGGIGENNAGNTTADLGVIFDF
ncbi:porin [uncultured Roseobacter sp.]|uniref:porin n=1 Tax=uncultured Roseobacter sp. TaxID=114847 RepID=UPI0026305371|nr:porin [uncultured Roseobacter sp.]